MEYLPCSLALGGGGLKGAAHVGVLQVFEEEGFSIQYISGTSAGALIGAMYALGYSSIELQGILKEFMKHPVDFQVKLLKTFGIVFKSLLTWLKVCKYETELGLVRGKQLEEYLRYFFGNRGFEELRYPLLVTAVDLLSGRLKVFTDLVTAKKLKGFHDIDVLTGIDLVTAVRASTAIPGIFTPVYYQGMVLVDGGVRDIVPADLLRYAGAKRIVGVDLLVEDQTEECLTDLFAILMQTIDVMGREATDLVLERYADYILQPKIKPVCLTDYDKLQGIYEIGYLEAKRKVPALKSLLRKSVRQVRE